MAKYEYKLVETKSIDVPNCPLCGSEDLHFWNYSRDTSMHGAAAGVKCKCCGHEVKVDGNKLQMDCGKDCQRAAIEEWKYQVSKWGENKHEGRSDSIIKLKERIKDLEEENEVLKTVISLDGYKPCITYTDYENGLADIKTKFQTIMGYYPKCR